jgi:hypothetical protein
VAFASTPFATHRLTTGRLVAWVVGVAALVGVADIVRRGLLGQYGSFVCALLAVVPVVYVLGVRPRLVEGPNALEVHNPLRTTVVPWAAVDDVDVTDVLRIRYGGEHETYLRCFAVPRRRPAPSMLRSASTTGQILPAKNPEQGWQPPTGQPRAAALAQRLKDLRDWHGRGYAGAAKEPPGEVVTQWAPDALAAMAVAAVLVVVAIVLL